MNHDNKWLWFGAISAMLLSGAANAAPAESSHKHHSHKAHAHKTHAGKTHHHAHVVKAAFHEVDAAPGSHPNLASSSAMIFDLKENEALYGKNTDAVVPIASITKLMTAMVTLDANLPMDEELTVRESDVDVIKHSSSKLPVGVTLTRYEMLRVALMASENRAAAELGRSYPGGLAAFVEQMNLKAKKLGMTHTHFVDPTGLNSANVSTAADLVRMVEAAYGYEAIRHFTTTSTHAVVFPETGRAVTFNNTNTLVKYKNKDWQIGLSKTGYITEAGRCLVMQSTIADKPVVIVLLDSWGKQSRIGDANRIKKWIESRAVSKQRFG